MESPRPVDRILEFIGRFRPAYARTLRCEMAGMTEDEQEDRVTQALAAIRPRESEMVPSSGLSEDDRAFLDELAVATGELRRATERLKAELQKSEAVKSK